MSRQPSLDQGLRRFFYLVTKEESSFQNLQDVPDYLNEAIPFFLGAVFIEYVIALLKGLPTVRFNDGFSSFAAGITRQSSKLVLRSVELSAYCWVYENYRITTLDWNSTATWWVCFIAADIGFYFFHRGCHEINFMWAAHQVHHSSEDFNLTTAVRQSFLQRYFSWVFYCPLSLAIPPSVFYTHFQLNLLYQFWIHTQVVQSLGPLEYILNTPSHHRVHHGRNPYCIDKNFGGVLIVWDRIFGTFQAEGEEKVVYGLVYREHVSTWNPMWIQLCYYVELVKRVWLTPGIGNKLSVIFKAPSWSPGKSRTGEPKEYPEIESPVVKYNKTIGSTWANIYVLLHFGITIAAFQVVVANKSALSQASLWAFVFGLMFSLTCFGAMFDSKSYAPYLEVTRCLLFLGADAPLLFQSSNLLRVSRAVYIVSLLVWGVAFVKRNKPPKAALFTN